MTTELMKKYVGEFDTQLTRPTSGQYLLIERGLGDYAKIEASLVGGGGGAFVTVGPENSGANFLTSDYDSDYEAGQAGGDYLISQGGGTLLFLPGTYNIEKEMTFIGSDFVIQGVGYKGTNFFLTDMAKTEIFVIGNAVTACNRVSARGFAMNGNKANQTLGGSYPAGTNVLFRYRSDGQNCYGGEVSGIYAYNGIQIGLSSESHSGLDIHNNFTEENGQFGIWFENGESTTITNNYSGEDNTAIKVYSASKSVVTGNISKSAKNGAFALQQAQEVCFGENVAHRPGWHGLTFTVSPGFNLSAVKNSVFDNNACFGAYGHGLQLNGCDDNVFSNFVFRRNGLGTTNTYSDIYMTDEGGGTVCNNNYFSQFSFNNESPAYYSERVRSNIRMNRADAHTGNVFDNFKFDRTNLPLTAYVENVFTNTAQGTGANVEKNTIRNSLGINPDIDYFHGDKTGAVTVSRVLGMDHTMRATGNITLTITDGLAWGSILRLKVIQDGTGGRTISKPANVKLVGGAFSPSAGAGAIDQWTLQWDGTSWNEIGRSLNVS